MQVSSENEFGCRQTRKENKVGHGHRTRKKDLSDVREENQKVAIKHREELHSWNRRISSFNRFKSERGSGDTEREE